MAAGFRLERHEEFGVVTLDTPGRPVNTLGTSGLADFEALLDSIESERTLRGVVLISAKPKTFLAGADLDELKLLRSADEARSWVERGQQALRRWERLRIPTVAAIRGAALGGGLEVALACRYRVAADTPATVLGLPEVQLGLIPALGGTHRLPRLVGLRRGVEMLLAGSRLGPREALRIGLVDEVVAEAILLPAAMRWLVVGKKWRRRSPRGGFLARLATANPVGRALFFRAAREQAERKGGGHYPAPAKILAAARVGAARGGRAAERLEAASFGELATSEVSRRLLELFRATRELATESTAAAEPIRGIGVLGAGFMGSGIAAAAARAGHPVRLLDSDPKALAKGLAFCRGRFDDLVRRRKFPPAEARAAFDRILPAHAASGFERCDLVIEAVVEDLAVKRALLAKIEHQLRPSALLASNTSTLPIAELARGMTRPGRILGLHFFSPVHRMPLVEIIRHRETAAPAIARAQAFVRELGKTPIVVRDSPGFYTSRILSPYLAEAGRLLAAGATVAEVDAAGRAAGFPVGPFELLDEVGIDIAAKAARTMADAFPERMPYPGEFQRLVEAGRLGRKSRRGFYNYQRQRKRPAAEALTLLGVKPRPGSFEAADLADRLLFAMVAEAIRCLEEGIISSSRDGDVGAVLGLGFPPFQGGPFRFVDSLGPAQTLMRLEALAALGGPPFAPPARLREMAGQGSRFYD